MTGKEKQTKKKYKYPKQSPNTNETKYPNKNLKKK